ncbi:hypothetical protein LEP1GSC120_3541 [Leptospira santarosai str. 200702252]|nr:hypothetical protein LEP1GSC130_2770 [Leptospira santarosai str. 200403458]EMO98226.1 hypothetical protein LEP1GSC120_3541 [Leptospira santarosai str. 200702252]
MIFLCYHLFLRGKISILRTKEDLIQKYDPLNKNNLKYQFLILNYIKKC